MANTGMHLTYLGSRLEAAERAAGNPLTITRAVFGSGEKSLADLRDVETVTKVEMELPLIRAKINGDSTAEFVFLLNNSDITEAFPIREIGVFAKANTLFPSEEIDENGNEIVKEILYAYTNFGEEYGWMPSATDARKVFREFRMEIIVGSTTELVVHLDPDWSVFALAEELTEHMVNPNAHANLPKWGTELLDVTDAEKIKYFLVDIGDNKASKAYLPAMQRILLGEDYGSILTYGKRLNAEERRMSEIFLYLAAQNMYPDSTSLVYGIFGSLDEDIDKYDVAVTSAVAGDDSVDVDSLEGIVPGGHYVISDGDNQENVQVLAFAKVDGVHRIVFTKPLTINYHLDSTRLYRTTAYIGSNGAEGSGDKKTEKWHVNTSWSGIVAGGETIYPLEFSMDKISNFTVTGDMTIDAENNATLWTESKLHIALPTQASVLKYNGEEQTVTFNGVN